MANTVVQFQIEESSRIQAVLICEKLGIDLSTYLRMCMTRLVQENGIPFRMKLSEESESSAWKAVKAASRIAEENGISNLTLDEINAEIVASRKQADG